MKSRDVSSLIKNVYDDETLDALKSLDQNSLALMHHNPIFPHVDINQYTRVPIKAGSSETHIRVDVSKANNKAFFFLSEDFVAQLNDSEDIRSQLANVLNKIKIALKL